ncbi:MAG: DUF1761 domain-containing protein [Bacteroidales bacterium]|nr:DUF1761 domain-containing protein [Bacteroidales bacterium]
MDMQTAFGNINWLSVVVASVAAFVVGSIWYSPLLFSNHWQKENKLTEDDLKSANVPLIFSLAFVLIFIATLVLELFIGKDATLVTGITASALVGIAWIATAFGINYLYARKSFRLFLIDAGYFVVFFIIMGTILGAW